MLRLKKTGQEMIINLKGPRIVEDEKKIKTQTKNDKLEKLG